MRFINTLLYEKIHLSLFNYDTCAILPQGRFEDPYYSPDYSSWLVIMSPNPGTINGFRFYHYVFVNAKTGAIYIDPVEREIDYEAEWHQVKIPQQPTTGPQYPVKSADKLQPPFGAITILL